jgi:hypothetical protein
MNRLTQLLPVLLAALLQIMPLVRNLFINPATGSGFAFILRWGIGTGATLGAYDAFSAASGTYMNSSSNLTGTVGVPMSTNINFVINGGNPADPLKDFFLLNNKPNVSGISTLPIFNGQSTNFALPPGLTFTATVVNNATNIYGVLSGTPTVAMTTNISI